jgi:hypothetical protein
MATITRPAVAASPANRWRRVTVATVAIAGMLAAVVALGVWWGLRSAAPIALSPEQPSWPGVVAGLDAVRDAALRSGDAGLLRSVHTATSASLSADLELLDALEQRSWTPGPTQPELVSVTEISASADTAALLVVDRMAAVDLIAGDGQPVRTQPGRAERSWRVTLQRVGGAWRFAEISAGPTPAASPR